MKREAASQIEDLVASIDKIGMPKKEFEFKNKRNVENLKKTRFELFEEAFGEAFDPNKD